MPYAIIMLHNRIQNFTMPKTVVKSFEGIYGENLKSIAIPVIESEQSLIPLALLTEPLKQKMDGKSCSEVVVVVVEANYGAPGSLYPHKELLKFCQSQFPNAEIIAASSTPNCLMSILTDPDFEKISISVKETDTMQGAKMALFGASNMPASISIEELMQKNKRRIYTGNVNMVAESVKPNRAVMSAPSLPKLTSMLGSLDINEPHKSASAPVQQFSQEQAKFKP